MWRTAEQSCGCRESLCCMVSVCCFHSPREPLGSGAAAAQRHAQSYAYSNSVHIGTPPQTYLNEPTTEQAVCKSYGLCRVPAPMPINSCEQVSSSNCSFAARKALTLQPISSAQGRLASSDFNTLALKMPSRGRGRLMGNDQRLQAEADTASHVKLYCFARKAVTVHVRSCFPKVRQHLGWEVDKRLPQAVAGPKASSST